jgi:hypothetical protein
VLGDTRRRFVVRRGQDVERCGVHAPSEVAGPIHHGQKLGTLQVCRGKRPVATLPLVASADVPQASAAVRTKDWFTRPLTLVLVVLAGLGGSVLLARVRRRGLNGRRPSRREAETA